MSLTSNTPYLTVWDSLDYVLDQVVAGDYSPRGRRLAWDAVLEAYGEIPVRRNWRYFYRTFTLNTVASQTDGTIAYTASTRTVTLTSSTWPSDVTKYSLYLSGARYSISSRTSSTVIVLRDGDCPTADIASGTSYTITRDTYELPDTIREVLYVHDLNAPGRLLQCVEPSDILHEQRISRNISQPLMYAAYRSDLYAGAMAIHFAPSPSGVRTYQYQAMCWPLPLKVLEYSVGTVATTSGSSTVTGTGTAFTSDMAGAVMRFTKTGDTSIPTSLQGEIDKNRVNPYAMQRVIRSVESTTSLTLEQDADTTLSGSGYRISSRIDIEPGSMRSAFLRCCEAKFATQDRKGEAQREARYERALVFAMAADQRSDDRGGSPYYPYSLADIAASVDLTTGGTQP